MTSPSTPVIERFWLRVNKDGPEPPVAAHLGPCWLWTGWTNKKGYGEFSTPKHRRYRAHRYAYEALIGPLPAGLVIDHLCRVPACVNPRHMEPVTAQENYRRGVWGNRTACLHGHEYTPENTRIRRRGTYTWRECRACFRQWARDARARRNAA